MRRALTVLVVAAGVVLTGAGVAEAAPPARYTVGDESSLWPQERGRLTLRCDDGDRISRPTVAYGREYVTKVKRYRSRVDVHYYNPATEGGDVTVTVTATCTPRRAPRQ